MVIQLGLPPHRIDLLTSVSGLPDFTHAWTHRIECTVDGVPVAILGRQELIQSKRAAGRLKGLSDLEALGELPPMDNEQ